MSTIQLAIYDKIVRVPHVIDSRVTVVADTPADLINDSRNPRPKTEIKYAREAVDLCGDNTNNLIANAEAGGGADGRANPHILATASLWLIKNPISFLLLILLVQVMVVAAVAQMTAQLSQFQLTFPLTVP